jgi:hypothetical protein
MVRNIYWIKFKLKVICLFSLVIIQLSSIAQLVNPGMTDNYDSLELGKITISGIVDVYYGYDFNEPPTSNRSYAVSSIRHNEVNINLAYIDIRYLEENVRARFVPGVGTYVNSNYAAESGTLKNIIEANAGIRVSKKHNVWVDVGVLGSPITNETAISKDHLLYTRGFAGENVPYYLTGVRVSAPLSEKITAYAYVVNGWQQITDVNNPLSVLGQIEYKPNAYTLINLNAYMGSEESAQNPTFGNRYFTDAYFVYQKRKITLTGDVYAGLQNRLDTLTGKRDHNPWWQANLCGRYSLNHRLSFSTRGEYYSDPYQIIIKPITDVNGFSTFSGSLCFDVKTGNHALFRFEGRQFFSKQEVYIDKRGEKAKSELMLIANLCVWF